MKQLTKEQQDLVTKNHNLIYGFAHDNNLLLEDWYGILAIALCESAASYDSEKGAFSTYAYRNMKYAVLKEERKRRRFRNIPKNKIVHYDALEDMEIQLDKSNISYFADSKSVLEFDEAVDKIIYDKMMNELNDELNDKQKNILHMMVDNGMKQVEIAKEMGCSRQYVSIVLCKMREQLKPYLYFD